jgi:pyruvate/2-oxoglutarate dehydrogenase complex dihydrolipoamide dehydrogenase (E3) component
VGKDLEVDICVIGAGSAGLSVAAGAAQLGAATLLVERGRMGGDCLNFGCVPSKALLVAAKAAKFHRGTEALGVRYTAPSIDFPAVRDHVRRVIASIAPNDSVERFEGLGVQVLPVHARFVGPRELDAGGTRIRARRFVVASGSSPLVPPISGLEDIDYLTNETVFDLTQCPAHLIVVGGGPIGCELGQAFRLLGAEVSIIEMAAILPRDDPELVDILRTRLRGDGVRLYEGTKVVAVEKTASGIAARLHRDGREERLEGSTLLIAAGRQANVDGLDLEAAGVGYDRRGIHVDRRLRTTNRKIYAAGDVVGGHQFTHIAGYHAGIVIRNALFRWPARLDDSAVPWVTYCEPELAHVGRTETEARRAHANIRVLRWPYAENDRARAERRIDGLIKVVTTPKGRILGASIVGAQAGELIHPWVLALSRHLKIGAMATAITPYPTLGEIGKRAAGSFYVPKLFSERTRRLVRFLGLFG